VQDRTRNRSITAPVLIRFHGSAHRRVRLGYLVGLSFVICNASTTL